MRIPLFVIAACLIALPVSATPITYEFTGTIDSVTGSHAGIRFPGLTARQTFLGTATLDDESIDRLMVTIGAHTVGHTISSMSAFTDAAGQDRLNMHVTSWLISSTVDGFFRGELMSLEMVDPTGTALTSTSLSQDFQRI